MGGRLSKMTFLVGGWWVDICPTQFLFLLFPVRVLCYLKTLQCLNEDILRYKRNDGWKVSFGNDNLSMCQGIYLRYIWQIFEMYKNLWMTSVLWWDNLSMSQGIYLRYIWDIFDIYLTNIWDREEKLWIKVSFWWDNVLGNLFEIYLPNIWDIEEKWWMKGVLWRDNLSMCRGMSGGGTPNQCPSHFTLTGHISLNTTQIFHWN